MNTRVPVLSLLSPLFEMSFGFSVNCLQLLQAVSDAVAASVASSPGALRALVLRGLGQPSPLVEVMGQRSRAGAGPPPPLLHWAGALPSAEGLRLPQPGASPGLSGFSAIGACLVWPAVTRTWDFSYRSFINNCVYHWTYHLKECERISKNHPLGILKPNFWLQLLYCCRSSSSTSI